MFVCLCRIDSSSVHRAAGIGRVSDHVPHTTRRRHTHCFQPVDLDSRALAGRAPPPPTRPLRTPGTTSRTMCHPHDTRINCQRQRCVVNQLHRISRALGAHAQLIRTRWQPTQKRHTNACAVHVISNLNYCQSCGGRSTCWRDSQ